MNIERVSPVTAAATEFEIEGARFSRSSFCSMNGCVEVARLGDGGVAVRDSKDLSQPALLFTAEEWTAFVAGVRAGEFGN